MIRLFRHLYEERNLIRELIRKGILLKYRSSVLGIVWSFIEPLLTTAILVIVFGTLLGHREPSFSLYIITGRMIYQFYTNATKSAGKSILANASLIRKVYVPLYLYTLSEVLWQFLVFLLSLTVILPVALYARVMPTLRLWHIIPAIIFLLVLTLGSGLILATCHVYLRDTEYLWNVLLLVIMYISAIFYYPERLLDSRWGFLLNYNPLFCIISLFRSGVLGTPMTSFMLFYPALCSTAVLLLGILIFRANQYRFVQYI